MKEKYIAHSDDTEFEKKVKELLLYRRVVSVETTDDQTAVLTLDNGMKLITSGNRGCGGCENGWYYLQGLNHCDNAITNVECTGDYESYHIYVYAEDQKINLLEYAGCDNGYYGTGYSLSVVLNDADIN